MSYERRSVGVVVDLSNPSPDGGVGEEDQISGIENATGGRGGDRLAGTDATNSLRGGGGSDLLRGRGGSDYLYPGTGADTVSCGAGFDLIDPPVNALDYILPGCETIFVYGRGESSVPAYPLSARSDSVTFTVECPSSEEDQVRPQPRCSGAYRLREASGRRRLLGTGRFPRGRWDARPVTVRLTAIGQRLASRSKGVIVVVSLAGRNVDGARWRIRLRVPG